MSDTEDEFIDLEKAEWDTTENNKSESSWRQSVLGFVNDLPYLFLIVLLLYILSMLTLLYIRTMVHLLL